MGRNSHVKCSTNVTQNHGNAFAPIKMLIAIIIRDSLLHL
jgi:hypothetical protein